MKPMQMDSQKDHQMALNAAAAELRSKKESFC